MADMLQCTHCDALNALTWSTCIRCRRSLRGAPTTTRRTKPTWGHDVLERARNRREPTTECPSCGADNPIRFTRCQACRAPTRAVEVPMEVRCPSCRRWNAHSSGFCVECGDPLTETGERARWRPDGCPGCFGDLVPQPDLHFCGTCGSELPATLLERREVLRSVAANRGGGGYRGGDAPELHPARCELSLRIDDASVWVALVDSRAAALTIDLVVEPSPEDSATRAGPGSLLRLAGSLRARFSGLAQAREVAACAALLEAAEAATNRDERILQARAHEASLQLAVDVRRRPSPARVDFWLAESVKWWAARPA